MTPHVLVFGGTGRLGPLVIENLTKTKTVSLFTRRSDEQAGGAVQLVQCDLASDIETRRAVTKAIVEHADETSQLGILYMATRGLTAESATDVCSEYAIAVEGFYSVVRAVLECDRSWKSVSVVFASSEAVRTLPPGSMGYAIGKAAGESLCRYMAHHPPGPNWRFNVLRVGRVSRAKCLAASVAKLADFLLDEESEEISGQVFTATAPTFEVVSS